MKRVLVAVLVLAAAGWLAARRRGWIVLAALGVLTVGEFALAYPDVLASVNLPAGGAGRGERWVAGTDVDWGQGLKGLAAWMRDRSSRVCLSGAKRYMASATPP